MKKVSFVLERKFSEQEIKDVREFHQVRLEQAAARQDKESAGAAALMLKFFTFDGGGSQWVGMSYYEDEDKATEAAQLFSKSDEYRLVKATFTSAAKGIWGGYQVVEDKEAAAK